VKGVRAAKATTIATRMTRIKRIYADFALPAAKFFGHELHEFSQITHSLRSCQRAFAQTKFVPEFVKIRVIRGKSYPITPKAG